MARWRQQERSTLKWSSVRIREFCSFRCMSRSPEPRGDERYHLRHGLGVIGGRCSVTSEEMNCGHRPIHSLIVRNHERRDYGCQQPVSAVGNELVLYFVRDRTVRCIHQQFWSFVFVIRHRNLQMHGTGGSHSPSAQNFEQAFAFRETYRISCDRIPGHISYSAHGGKAWTDLVPIGTICLRYGGADPRESRGVKHDYALVSALQIDSAFGR